MTAATIADPYAGMSRAQLTEILMRAGKKPENLSEPGLFRAAWKTAPFQPVPVDPVAAPASETAASTVTIWQFNPVHHRLVFTTAEEGRQNRKSLQCKEFPRSDLGNAQRFALRFGRDARYCHPFNSWFVWSGRRWRRDNSGLIYEIGKDVVLRLGDEAPLYEFDSERTAAFKWAAGSQSKGAIENLVALSRSSLPISPDELDRDPLLFNTTNGTLNLQTMEFREHRQQDFITKLAGVGYDPIAPCPLWKDHLELVFNDDNEFINGFQEICGYSLIHGNPEQLMFILYGTGKNGKTVTLETLAHAWGEYAVNIAPESLMKRRNNDGPRGDIARIAGAHLITSSEGEDGARLSESIVKMLTGGDRVTVRNLYEKEFEFTPPGKIWLSTNHKPVILGTDIAIWRRLWLIPFNVTIPEEKRDTHIVDKLALEGSGILNWCLVGLKRYLDNGKLPQPVQIAKASETYRDESDLLGEFITDRCVMQGEVERRILLAEYKSWCNDVNEKPVSSRRFASLLRDRGVSERMDHGTRKWVGMSPKGLVKFS
jgi:putative DNA primase/helicase